jgi:hypothetical protein
LPCTAHVTHTLMDAGPFVRHYGHVARTSHSTPIPETSIVIIGAGVDVPFNLPTVPDTIRALAEFCRGDGKGINAALRKKVANVRLSFEHVGGDTGDELVSRLFEHPDDVRPKLVSIRAKVAGDSGSSPIGQVLDALSTMAASNQVDGSVVQQLAAIAGESGYADVSESVLDPRRLILTSLVRSAIRRSFEDALLRSGTLSADERRFIEEIVVATSNIENLLASHFIRFAEAGEFAERRSYLYLAWIFWSLLMLRSLKAGWPTPCFYEAVRTLRPIVVTFNYTNFMGGPLEGRLFHFHGRLDQYLRVDDREMVANDGEFRALRDDKSIEAFIKSRRLNVNDGSALDLPGIVPPLTFKPLMSRPQLLAWAAVDSLLQSATHVVIVGYSFAVADEHFNDLLRHAPKLERVTVINPDLDGTTARAAGVLRLDSGSLKRGIDRHGRETLRVGHLTGIKARSEEIRSQELRGLLT